MGYFGGNISPGIHFHSACVVCKKTVDQIYKYVFNIKTANLVNKNVWVHPVESFCHVNHGDRNKVGLPVV